MLLLYYTSPLNTTLWKNSKQMNFVLPIPTGKVTKLAKEFCFRLTKVMADNIVTIRPAECRLAELFRMFYMAERGCHTVSPNSIWRSDYLVVAPRIWGSIAWLPYNDSAYYLVATRGWLRILSGGEWLPGSGSEFGGLWLPYSDSEYYLAKHGYQTVTSKIYLAESVY